MTLQMEPSALDNYRKLTKDAGRPGMIFTGTRVCKCCRKTRSIAQFKSDAASMCNVCRGVK